MLLIDVGNTFIKWARPNSEQMFSLESIVWKNFGTVTHHELDALKKVWEEMHEDVPIRQVLISNVAGQQVSNTLLEFLATLTPKPLKIEHFYSEATRGGITNTYLDCKKLGSDRFASMIGAHSLFPNKALVVVTAGTATTIDAISPDGTFLGGMILPGLKLMAESLARNTAQLPDIRQMDKGTTIFADTTDKAMLNGCINAQAGAIERAVHAHRQQFADSQCLLSGGAACYIAPSLSIPFKIIDNLVLIGLFVALVQKAP